MMVKVSRSNSNFDVLKNVIFESKTYGTSETYIFVLYSKTT